MLYIYSIYIYIYRIRDSTAPKSYDRLKWEMWFEKCYPSTIISVFLTGFRYFSYEVTTQLSSRGWVDLVPGPILPEKFLGYSRESNPGPLGWQSYVLTTILKSS